MQTKEIESIQGKGNLLNRTSKAFNKEELQKVDQVRKAAGLSALTDE
jgi:hypothetical protein